MKHPAQEVNGSGRILFCTLETVSKNLWKNTSLYGGTPSTEYKVERGQLQEGFITEWSPSGAYIRINNNWYLAHNIELLEVLPR